MGLLNWLFSPFKNRIQPKPPIQKAFGVESAVSGKMEQNIQLWWSMYVNDAPWQTEDVRPLGIPAAICRELARPALVEFQCTVSGSKRADYINGVVQNLMQHIRWDLERGLATGGIAFKPFLYYDQLLVDATTSVSFTPTKFDGMGRAIAGVFQSAPVKQNGEWYVSLEYHELNGTDYTIRNKAYRSDEHGTVRDEVPLSTVSEWANLPPEVTLGNIQRPLFAYFEVPAANNIEPASNVAVSIYGGASAELIKQADEQWDRLQWEYKSGERKVFVDGTSVNVEQYGEDRLYGFAPLLNQDDPFHDFSPTLRDDAYYRGFQNTLKLIEFNVGLAFGTISDPQTVDKTATEIMAGKQRMFVLVKDILDELQHVLEDLVYALDVYAWIYNMAPAGPCKVEFERGDNILNDAESERLKLQDMRLDVSAGVIRPELYIAKKYKVTEEEAKRMMPEMTALLEGP